MADNIYGDQFNPYVKKEDTSTGIHADAQNTAENTEQTVSQAENGAQVSENDVTVKGEDTQDAGAAEVQASADGQTPSMQGGASHTFTQEGQYNIVRPQGGTTYIPPRSNYQQFTPQSGPQTGGPQTGGPQTGTDYNPGNQQTYHRPYSSYSTGSYGYAPPPPPPPKRERKRGVGAGILALVCVISVILSGVAGFTGAYVANGIRTGGSGGSVVSSDSNIAVLHREVVTDVGEDGVATLTEVVTAVENSVVEITTEFKSMGYFQYVTSGAGSGVIISDNGYIITNNHVITNDNKVADAISVRLKNGETYEATVIGTDSDTDVAVIKIEGEEAFTPAVFADSDQLVVGQDIVAIGNPLGELGGTVTEGIISALDREVDVDGTTMNLLQFSAAVNPGNSGGGLFNMKGQLVGIVNAKSSGEGIEGLGFAIPANDASTIAEELMTNGYVTGKPYLGISLYYAADAYTAYRYFQSQIPGLYIAEVVDGYNDGVLETGDRVIAVNGNEISTSDDVKNYVNECEIGDTMTFSLYRKGKLMEVEVTCYEYVPEKSQVSFD